MIKLNPESDHFIPTSLLSPGLRYILHYHYFSKKLKPYKLYLAQRHDHFKIYFKSGQHSFHNLIMSKNHCPNNGLQALYDLSLPLRLRSYLPLLFPSTLLCSYWLPVPQTLNILLYQDLCTHSLESIP